jgi:crossover junction endodeoxyribonuclease RuvC
MIIGIDPGLTGAIAFIGRDGYIVEDLPTMANGKGKAKVKRQIDPGELAEMIKHQSNQSGEKPIKVYLERVAAMNKQGVSSVFSLGETYGAIKAVVATLQIPIEIISPQEWKKFYNLRRDKKQSVTKELSRTKAIELFPEASLTRKKDHNLAEALLIANYGVKKENGRP